MTNEFIKLTSKGSAGEVDFWVKKDHVRGIERLPAGMGSNIIMDTGMVQAKQKPEEVLALLGGVIMEQAGETMQLPPAPQQLEGDIKLG